MDYGYTPHHHYYYHQQQSVPGHTSLVTPYRECPLHTLQGPVYIRQYPNEPIPTPTIPWIYSHQQYQHTLYTQTSADQWRTFRMQVTIQHHLQQQNENNRRRPPPVNPLSPTNSAPVFPFQSPNVPPKSPTLHPPLLHTDYSIHANLPAPPLDKIFQLCREPRWWSDPSLLQNTSNTKMTPDPPMTTSSTSLSHADILELYKTDNTQSTDQSTSSQDITLQTYFTPQHSESTSSSTSLPPLPPPSQTSFAIPRLSLPPPPPPPSFLSPPSGTSLRQPFHFSPSCPSLVSPPHLSSPSLRSQSSHHYNTLPDHPTNFVIPLPSQKKVPSLPISDKEPPYSFSALTALAISSYQYRMATLTEIYAFISTNFPFYKRSQRAWKNSIRNCLHANKCFKRSPVSPPEDPSGKSVYWMIDPYSKTHFLKGSFKKKIPTSKKSLRQDQEEINLGYFDYLRVELIPHEVTKICHLFPMQKQDSKSLTITLS